MAVMRLSYFVSLLIITILYLEAVTEVQGVSRADFPADFVFGSGTSALQYEGAAFEDGRTPSFWDTFAHSGHTHGANADVGCDGYHKYKEDIGLMFDTGLEAFRLSISWSRLIPNGRGPVNAKGLLFYNNLINEFLSHGIELHITLIHLDLPQTLEDEYGGWLSRNIVKDFMEFADVCFREFGDRVLHWTTVNEANVAALGGYGEGLFPPGRCSTRAICPNGDSSTEPYTAAHNMLLAHAAAAKMYKERYKATQNGEVGISIYAFGLAPYTNSMEDVKATKRAHEFYIGWILDPVIFGDYPETLKKHVQTRLPAFTSEESEQIKGSVDFIGLNHYDTIFIKDNPDPQKDTGFFADMAAEIIYDGNGTLFDQYPVRPWGLETVLEYLKEVYGNPPIYIQENVFKPLLNGLSRLCNHQYIHEIGSHSLTYQKFEILRHWYQSTGQLSKRNGTLNDTHRVEYIQAYIGGVHNALRNGSNVKGYLTWTFLDCLELFMGWNISFGLYYVDLEDKDLKRYPKLSARWYSNFLKGKSMTAPNGITQIKDNKSVTLSLKISQ